MSTTSIGQLMADMRQLVISLQTRERATDNALAKSQILSDKISGMKEYQEEVANMNDCWRMQGRKVLVAGLQHENRQILQLQQENRELRQALEDCENTLQLIMQKHRDVVTKLAKQFIPSFRASVTHTSKKCETSINEKIVILSRLLNECLADGESVLNHDQELIARLATENACLRELLNISTHNEPNIARHFLDLANDGIPNYSDGSTTVYDKNCEQSDVSFTGDSLLHNKEAVRQNSVLMEKIPDTMIKRNAKIPCTREKTIR
uniref:FGFR1 oncogene partner 2 homolog n=1 Tax=Wuchereria bancrofti TaxID=6293 RepID=A0AAF5RXY6_WUCBA